MTSRDKALDNFGILAIGASLASWFTYFGLDVERAETPAIVSTAVWVGAVVLSRYLRLKKAATEG